MTPWLTDNYGNASGIYKMARDAKTALEDSRRTAAECLGTEPNTLYFTSGGTESDNWALKGAVDKGGGIAVSAVEHHAVLNTAEYLKKKGHALTVVPVDGGGLLSPEALRKALRPDTAVVSVIYANNEIGTVQPIADLARTVKEYNKNILFHTDAVQAVGHIPVEITPDIDMLSLSAHKFGGPKGVGALVIRKGLRLPPLLHGGGQEHNARSGTENVPGIVGMAAALREAATDMAIKNARLTALRDRLTAGVLAIPDTLPTGDPVDRLPGLASFIIRRVEGESVILKLDQYGICASTGSACSSNSLEHSHVLTAVGLPVEDANCSLRLSLSTDNTDDDVGYILQKLPVIVTELRELTKGIDFSV
jgi:cysteine desulfurase